MKEQEPDNDFIPNEISIKIADACEGILHQDFINEIRRQSNTDKALRIAREQLIKKGYDKPDDLFAQVDGLEKIKPE